MENTDMFNNATAQLTFHDFLDRMRDPSAADLVRSIKNFIGAFQSNPPDPEKDSKRVQQFLANTENAFKAHPLWVGATDEELESSGEGLEKYLMTKLWPRAFAPVPEDAEIDEQLSEKMTLLQEFIRPEHLDIPKNTQNEASWLLAQKELQRINTYKSPRDKLVCILNCCRVINNLLVKVSMASNDSPPGADDFLPVLIYIVIKANPPQLHSNLQYIQRYRHQGRLVSEAAYFFTNLVSAESFIQNLDSSSLSMDPAEFEKRMQAGRLALQKVNGVQTPFVASEKEITATEGAPEKRVKSPSKPAPTEEGRETPTTMRKEEQVVTKVTRPGAESAPGALITADKLEAGAAAQVLAAEKSGQLSKDYPFLYSSAGDLRVMDIEALLHEYKELVLRYVALRKAVESSVMAEKPSTAIQKQDVETEAAVPIENSVASEKPYSDTKEQDAQIQSEIVVEREESVPSGISERSISQVPASSDFRVEVSPGELLGPEVIDPSTKPEATQELPQRNEIATKSEHSNKHPSSPGEAEDASDLLDTRDLGASVEQHKGLDKLEMEKLDHADESKDIPIEATVPQEDTANIQSR